MWIGLSLFTLATLVVVGAVVRTTKADARTGNSDSLYIGL
jgi:hypothetical protein